MDREMERDTESKKLSETDSEMELDTKREK